MQLTYVIVSKYAFQKAILIFFIIIGALINIKHPFLITGEAPPKAQAFVWP